MPRSLSKGRSEKEVTVAVLDAARLYGIVLERRNVGLAFNAKGRPVPFGKPGEPDYRATLPGGRVLAVEMKRSTFDPRKLRGKDRDHFDRQIAEMRRINAAGGLAFWVRDGVDAARAFARIMSTPGLRVDVDDDGFCFLE